MDMQMPKGGRFSSIPCGVGGVFGAIQSTGVAMYGTDPWKLSRKTSPETSKIAGNSVDSAALEAAVYESIKRFPYGCSQDDVLAMHPGKPYSSITARFKALLDKGLIRDTGLRKPGKSGRPQRVLMVIK
jgi:hypothetical protein